MITRLMASIIVLSGSHATASADEVVPPQPAYRAIMDAQYAARQRPLPARPEEAQRIYENYLRSIGKPARDLSSDLGSNITSPSR
jgi:hypothetical protein